jgi:hypothetical protein
MLGNKHGSNESFKTGDRLERLFYVGAGELGCFKELYKLDQRHTKDQPDFLGLKHGVWYLIECKNIQPRYYNSDGTLTFEPVEDAYLVDAGSAGDKEQAHVWALNADWVANNLTKKWKARTFVTEDQRLKKIENEAVPILVATHFHFDPADGSYKTVLDLFGSNVIIIPYLKKDASNFIEVMDELLSKLKEKVE